MSSKKSNMRKESGITLIALIITIIILVVLAAVSIRAITNQSIVGHAVNGSQDYAKAGKEENKVIGDAGNLIDKALEKLDDIQNSKGLTFDLNGGVGPDGKTKYSFMLPQDEMTMEEFQNWLMSDENAKQKYFNLVASYRKGYAPLSTEDANGTSFENISTFTNDTVITFKWQATDEAGYNSIVSTNLNGGELVLPSAYAAYEPMYRAFISKGYVANVISYLNEASSHITKEGYILDGYYYIDNDEEIDIDISANLTDAQIQALDGKTIYLRWKEKGTEKIITVYSRIMNGGGGYTDTITLHSNMTANECYQAISNKYGVTNLSEICTDSAMTTPLFTTDSGNIVFNNLTFDELPSEIWTNDYYMQS